MLGVSQHSLHRRRFELEGGRLCRASLFPFFDDEGRTKAIMLAGGECERILLVEWRPDLFTRRWLRPHLLRLGTSSLDDADDSDARSLTRLWHFDPWWVLGAVRYSGHDVVPSLKPTNISGYDGSLTRIWFDRNLGRVTWTASGAGESMTIHRFAPQTLAAIERAAPRDEQPSPSRRARSEWRLRPFWQ